MKFIKSQTKSAKIKKLYILSCLLIISILLFFQYTQALFINKSKDVVTNIRVGDLRYELSSTSFNPNTTNITIDSNQEITVKINITNLNQIDTKYELYYEPVVDGIEIKFTKNSGLISDTITTNETKTLILNVNNSTDNKATITFKINSGFGHNKLALKNVIVEELELPNLVVDIVDNMIPVAWDGSTLIKADKTNQDNNWYDYDTQKWANAVLVTNSSRENYKSSAQGTPIIEDDILAYYTYIPRYKYLLWNANNNINCLNDNCDEQEIMIEFERKTTKKSTGSTNGQWLTHPAFTFGESELNGIWVGKFTTSPDTESTCYTSPSVSNCNLKSISPIIKPNLEMWRYTRVATMSSVSKQIKTNSMYGLNSYENSDSHMMKNMEWGAVAYLSHSKYGKYGNDNYQDENKQLYINNYRASSENAYKALTGCSSGAPSTGINITSCPHPYPGLTTEATGASTTGNIYGVYDMSGGVYEYMMGQLAQEGTELGTFYANSSSGTWDSIPELKYYDSYEYDTDMLTQGRGYLGDATRETLKTFGTSVTGGWYSDYSGFPGTLNVWFLRGGFANGGSAAGAFAIGRNTGYSSNYNGFRVVLTLE